MDLEALLALTLLCRSPHVQPARAAYHARALAAVVAGDERVAAALLVHGRWESGWAYRYERCLLPGKGGWGTYGVADLWELVYPGGTCGPIEYQARGARNILLERCAFDASAGDANPAARSVRRAFSCYIGAVSQSHPVAIERTAEYWATLEGLRTASCQ